MRHFNILLFDGFETLDAFGPAEIIGRLTKDCRLGYYSVSGGIVKSTQGIKVQTEPVDAMETGGILLIPGGAGTRKLVCDDSFIGLIRELSQQSEYTLTVCTGSALLAKTGLLKGFIATSNKRAFDWASSMGPGVNWRKSARWTVDGKYYTSSGISAGLDMTLGFVADVYGRQAAEAICFEIEYVWNRHKECDPFALMG